MSDDHGNDTEPPRGRPFAPGQSGNPAGRPKGARNRTSLIMESLIDGAAESILQKALEKAKGGDPRMLELFLKPFLRQERPVTFELPEVRTAHDVAKLMLNALQEVSKGEMLIEEAKRIVALAKTYLEAIEATDFDKRLRVLEQVFVNQPR